MAFQIRKGKNPVTRTFGQHVQLLAAGLRPEVSRRQPQGSPVRQGHKGGKQHGVHGESELALFHTANQVTTPVLQSVDRIVPIYQSVYRTTPISQPVDGTTPISQPVDMVTPIYQPLDMISPVYRSGNMITPVSQSVDMTRTVSR